MMFFIISFYVLLSHFADWKLCYRTSSNNTAFRFNSLFDYALNVVNCFLENIDVYECFFVGSGILGR